MEENEIAYLKAEIARQNKIIDALLAANEALKLQIAHVNVEEGNKNVPVAVPNFKKGNIDIPVAVPDFKKGNIDSPVAIPDFTKGNIDFPVAVPNFTKGNIEVPVAVADFSKGNIDIPDNIPDFRKGNMNHPAALPAVIEINNANLYKLENFIATNYRLKVGKESIQRAAKLLLHFYNHLPGDYTTLMKLTGHSNFGLAKYIRSMKKRGWITSVGKQKFALTESTRKMVAGVFAETSTKG